jgi:hypothetical protein
MGARPGKLLTATGANSRGLPQTLKSSGVSPPRRRKGLPRAGRGMAHITQRARAPWENAPVPFQYLSIAVTSQKI